MEAAAEGNSLGERVDLSTWPDCLQIGMVEAVRDTGGGEPSLQRRYSVLFQNHTPETLIPQGIGKFDSPGLKKGGAFSKALRDKGF